ncbi:hypothetical protein HPB52_020816 [Rhipicephalus sanguineus]|uniref:Uncharacterized protein n=1 Tax=Rhipicephalus sanguineus TaxID=34632 RepID=A0A9D4PXJ6_RHISA|nr:hypothetical protein HPB52_020816 [Rhipicephalus sanguineus]
MAEKSTLAVYRCHKIIMMPEMCRCRVCEKEDETIEHVVLRCEAIDPAVANGAPQETALGFKQAIGDDGRCGVDRATVAATKERLECWRAACSESYTIASSQLKKGILSCKDAIGVYAFTD